MQKVITFGEIMLRLSPPHRQRFSQASVLDVHFGGGESNVAVSLANFGIPVEFVTRLPQNDIGQWALMELRKRNVGTHHIIRGGERLGIYFLEQGAIHRNSQVVYDRTHSSISTIKKRSIDWEEVFKDAQWFHWSGITPALSQNAANMCREAIEAANDLDVTISVDLNYRSKLWNYGKAPSEVMPALVEKSDIILASRFAAEEFFSIQIEEKEEQVKSPKSRYSLLCKELINHFPKAKKVLVTHRETFNASHNSYTAFLHDGKKIYEAPIYHISPIVDRVGGGDALMGGFIYGQLAYENDKKALDFAVASSCLKHTIPGDANLSTISEVEDLLRGKNTGMVSR